MAWKSIADGGKSRRGLNSRRAATSALRSRSSNAAAGGSGKPVDGWRRWRSSRSRPVRTCAGAAARPDRPQVFRQSFDAPRSGRPRCSPKLRQDGWERTRSADADTSAGTTRVAADAAAAARGSGTRPLHADADNSVDASRRHRDVWLPPRVRTPANCSKTSGSPPNRDGVFRKRPGLWLLKRPGVAGSRAGDGGGDRADADGAAATTSASDAERRGASSSPPMTSSSLFLRGVPGALLLGAPPSSTSSSAAASSSSSSSSPARNSTRPGPNVF